MQKYGQHFLVNKGIIEKITDSVVANAQGSIVEIGPGKGAMTLSMLERGLNNLTLIEIDPDMVSHLKANLPDYADYKIVQKDFLKTDLSDLPQGDITFVSNLPYIDAADILLKVLGAPKFKGAVFMFQREQAQRLSAKPETKQYGPLSVVFQALANEQAVCRVSPGSFSPMPKVDSVVLFITPREDGLFASAKHQADFVSLVKSVFAYRRKTVLNAMCEVYKKNKDDLIKILNRSGVRVSARAEEIGPRKYAELSKNLEGFIF